VLEGRLHVSFVSSTLQWGGAITLPIPGLDDASISVAPDYFSKGTRFQFAIGLKALLEQDKPLLLSGLPDGRPLPDITDGVLPRWDGEIKGFPLSLYLSRDAFGIFIPLSFTAGGVSLPMMISLAIKDERGNILGKAYAVPNNIHKKGSGLFILLPYLGAEPDGAPSPKTEMM
jgi:hypothetical protein